MKTRRLLFFAVMMLALVLNACAPVPSDSAMIDSPTATPGAMMDQPTATPDAMMDKPTVTPDAMMDKPTTTPDAMMDKPTVTPGAMMDQPTNTPDVMMDKSTATPDAMVDNSTVTPDAMMGKPTAAPDAMMDKPTATPDAMMDKPTATPDAMMDKPTATPDAMMQTPTWFSVKLTDVNTGTVFSLNDFKGKVVLVETIAVGCSMCLQQQQQLLALQTRLGPNSDLVRITLDIAPNDDAATLKTFASEHGFDWHFAVTPATVAHEIAQLYGPQFLDSSSAPILVVDRAGGVHPLASGLKSADELTKAIEPYLKAGM